MCTFQRLIGLLALSAAHLHVTESCYKEGSRDRVMHDDVSAKVPRHGSMILCGRKHELRLGDVSQAMA